MRTDLGWTLDPTVTFLNHGSYGATPEAVLSSQRAWRDRLEAEPVRFMERILPPRKERPVDIVLPVLTGPKDAVTVSAALLAAVAAGEIAPGEASVVGRLVELHLRAVEAHDLEARLAALEARQQ